MPMSTKVREVEYYYSIVADKPGEARKLLEFFSERGVNLLAFTVFPIGNDQSQLDFFPDDPGEMKKAAEDAGISLTGPKRAFLLQGKDHVGALYNFHLKLANAGVNIHAANGVVDGEGRFGYVIWVKPDEYEKASETLKASDWYTIQPSPPIKK